MKILKILSFCLLLGVLFTSCAEPKTFKDSSKNEFTAEPFGWANEAKKIDTVVYEVSAGNVALSIIFSETVVVPVYLTGWALYEPVRLKNATEATKPTDYTGVLGGTVLLLLFIFFWWRRKS